MKEYKVIKAKDAERAEELMNEMAQEGWEVVDVTLWYKWDIYLIVTFARNK